MANAPRDDNYLPTLLAVSSADGTTPVVLWADPTTHRLLVSVGGSIDGLSDVTITSAAQGDILYHNGTAWVNLAAGTSGWFLKTQGAAANPVWAAVTVSGFVTGSTDNAMLRADGTGGSTSQGSVISITDLGVIFPQTNDVGALGDATHGFGDIFLASGAVIDFANGNAVITHSSAVLTVSTGDLRVTTAGTNAASVVTVGGAQTLTSKTFGSDTFVSDGFGFVIGHSAQITLAAAHEFQVLGTADADSAIVVARFSADANQPKVEFLKSRNAAIGSNTIVQDNDNLGGLKWYADDGTDYATGVAMFYAQVDDASPAADDIGTAFVWESLPGGGDITRNEVMRLTASGNLLIGTTGAAIAPAANDGAALGITSTGEWSDLFLASGAVVNFAAGDVTITHAANTLTIAGGDVIISSPGTASGSVVTTDGTQELDNKTLDTAVGKGTWTASGTWTLPAITLGGNATLAENASIVLDAALSADGKYCGITEAGTAGAALAFGDCVYLAAADSRWELADASAASTSGDVKIGICVLAAAADGDPTTILLWGKVRADTAFPSFTISAPVHISETAGDLVVAAPTTTDSVTRRVGFANTADELFFCPSPDYYTHT